MVILVRCPDATVTLALTSRLELLIREGLITEYLGPDGWEAATGRKPHREPPRARPSCSEAPFNCWRMAASPFAQGVSCATGLDQVIQVPPYRHAKDAQPWLWR